MSHKNSKPPLRRTLNDLKSSSQTKNQVTDDKSGSIEEFGNKLESNPKIEIPAQEPAVNITADTKLNVLEAVVTSQRMEIEDWKSKAIRATADMANLQKQFDLDVLQAKKNGKKAVSKSILSFLTALNLAFTFTPDSEDPKVTKFVSTLKFSFDSLVKELSDTGIEVILPSIGDKFDPVFMNAVNGGGDDVELTVKQIVSPGLKIDGSLIQASSVLV